MDRRPDMDNKANESLGEVEQQPQPQPQPQPQQDTAKDIADMRKRLEEIEQNAAKIRENQAKLFREDAAVGSSQGDIQMDSSKGVEEEVLEPLSIFIGNVDYACTPDEVLQHFQACGGVNRVTIPSDMYGQPKGYAYVEFDDEEAVEEALRLNESELHGRRLRVMRKRRNVPGMNQHRPRRFKPYIAYGYEPSVPSHFYSPYGHSQRFKKPR